jgi:hypothetical protein
MKHGIEFWYLISYGDGCDSKMKKYICFILIFTMIFLSGCSVKSSDIKDYGVFRNYLPSGQDSAYTVFPKSIPSSAENIDYVFEYKETLLDPEIQLYLEYELSSEDYYQEIERIKKVKVKKSVKEDFSKSNYMYPTYVAVENYDSGFEYVMLDEEKYRLIYVYLKFYNDKKQIQFDLSYLPNSWVEYGETTLSYFFQSENRGFSIY